MCDVFYKQVFMLSVLWTDQTEVIIYRSFQEFKKFHVSLNYKIMNNIFYVIWYWTSCNIKHSTYIYHFPTEAAEEEVPSSEPFPEKGQNDPQI